MNTLPSEREAEHKPAGSIRSPRPMRPSRLVAVLLSATGFVLAAGAQCDMAKNDLGLVPKYVEDDGYTPGAIYFPSSAWQEEVYQ